MGLMFHSEVHSSLCTQLLNTKLDPTWTPPLPSHPTNPDRSNGPGIGIWSVFLAKWVALEETKAAISLEIWEPISY